MEKIPPPQGGRQYTAWADYADGHWHLAHQGENADYVGTPENWTRAGRAWAKRNGYVATMFIEGTDVRFVFAEEGDEGVPVPVPPEPVAGPVAVEARPEAVVLRSVSQEARDAWSAATAAFFSDAPPAPELRLRPVDPGPEAA